MECDLLVNHRSRSGKQAAARVIKELERHDFVINTIYAIKRDYPFEQAIGDLTKAPPTLLVIAAGDGTVSTALNHLSGQAIEIGIIPLGTTNNFARSLDIPLDLEGSVEAIKLRRPAYIDLGNINGTYFSNVASIGISAEIATRVTNRAKRRWGRLAYAVEGLRQLMTHRPFMVTIQDVRRNLVITLETHQVIVANGRYHAGREIAEDAAIDDGELIIFALGGRTRLSLIRHTIDFYVGGRRQIAHSSYFVGKNVELITSRQQSVELDGEVTQKTPVSASIKRGAVKIRFKQ